MAPKRPQHRLVLLKTCAREEKRGQDALIATLKSFAPAPGKKVNRISWTCTHIVYVHVADTDLGGEKTMEHNLVLVDLKPYHTKFGEDL